MEVNEHSRSTNSICLSEKCEATVTVMIWHRPHSLPDTRVTSLYRNDQPYVVPHISLTHNYTLYWLSYSFFFLFFNTTLGSNRWLALSVKKAEKQNPVLEIFFSFFFKVVEEGFLLVKGKPMKKRRWIESGTVHCSSGNFSSFSLVLPSLFLSIKYPFPITGVCLLWAFISPFCPRLPKSIAPHTQPPIPPTATTTNADADASTNIKAIERFNRWNVDVMNQYCSLPPPLFHRPPLTI